MTFSGNTFSSNNWDDAEFTGGEEDSDKKCTFFPRRMAQEALDKILAANSTMVVLEETILRSPTGPGLRSFETELANRMAQIRCTQMQILSNALRGKNPIGECLVSESKPGFKWIPKRRGASGSF